MQNESSTLPPAGDADKYAARAGAPSCSTFPCAQGGVKGAPARTTSAIGVPSRTCPASAATVTLLYCTDPAIFAGNHRGVCESLRRCWAAAPHAWPIP